MGRGVEGEYEKWGRQLRPRGAAAAGDTLRDAGYPLERLLQEGGPVLSAGHDNECLAPARADDCIAVVSWICKTGAVQAAWSHEARNADTGQLLARDHALWAFVAPEGGAGAPRGRLLEDVVRGPTR
jgi:acyl-CoA thioesterase FadM